LDFPVIFARVRQKHIVNIIKIGSEYLLDGKTKVKVIKPLNRSNTVFSVETPQSSILTVEKERLKELEAGLGIIA
jgi:hypothetical protein